MRRHYYEQPRSNANGAAWAMVMIMALAAGAFIAFLYPDIAHMPGLPEQVKNSGAPADRRGTFGGEDSRPVNIPDANRGINDYNATAQAQYDAAIKAGQDATPVPVQSTIAPLPLNSAGEPVISQEQQAQQSQSLQLAEQEGAAAADAQLAAQREAANADAAQRAPDVSYQDAVNLLHRDPCSVPRANPATCAQGLFKPTPVNK